MGQKVNPISLRLGINKFWESRWYSKKDFAKNLNDDLYIRSMLLKKYHESSIAKIDIERAAKQLVVKIHSARPGKIIGKQGKGIELIKDEIKKTIKEKDRAIKVDVFEVKNPDLNARLCALNISQQLERRVSFRRAMKKVMQQTMKIGAKGIKVRVAGRLNGAEMARKEWYMEGRVPLHTLRSDVDYGTAEALTTFGLIGVKVWIYKGEIFDKAKHLKQQALSKNQNR